MTTGTTGSKSVRRTMSLTAILMLYETQDYHTNFHWVDAWRIHSFSKSLLSARKKSPDECSPCHGQCSCAFDKSTRESDRRIGLHQVKLFAPQYHLPYSAHGPACDLELQKSVHQDFATKMFWSCKWNETHPQIVLKGSLLYPPMPKNHRESRERSIFEANEFCLKKYCCKELRRLYRTITSPWYHISG